MPVKVQEITPTVDPGALLAGAQFADAFRIEVDDPALDARHAAQRMMGHSPRWIEALLNLRHMIVAPFGLKTSVGNETPPREIIGLFPILSETPDRLIAGFDDKHLDFRVVVDVASAGLHRQVTATTLVLTHNAFGRIYLAVITPFHRLVVRTLLRQVAV
jgi:Protein of unknown function (DUF2867)